VCRLLVTRYPDNLNLAYTLSRDITMGIELLIRLNDGPAGRKRGDIVSVKECPCTWGYCERPPTYIVVRIEDTYKNKIKEYKGRHVLLDPSDKSENPITMRSRYRFNLDELPKDYKMVAPHLTVAKSIVDVKKIDRRIEMLAEISR